MKTVTLQVLGSGDGYKGEVDGWYIAQIALCPTHGQAIAVLVNADVSARMRDPNAPDATPNGPAFTPEEKGKFLQCLVDKAARVLTGMFGIPVAVAQMEMAAAPAASPAKAPPMDPKLH